VTPIRLGFVPLSDCAVIAIAKEKGFFRRHGVDAELSREVSWANVRDKVAASALDGAQMLAGMPIAATVGIDPVARPQVTALSLDLNGNAITVSNALWERMCAADPEATAARPITARALARVIAENRRTGAPLLRFAMVYPFATHHYELRYWLAAAAIDPEEDVRLTVVPPPRMVESLERGSIDGFCVGEPWNSLAVSRGLGRILVTKHEIWNNSPEKVFAVSRSFAEHHPEVHRATLRALIDAAVWTDASENRPEVARLLADERYVGLPASVLSASLTGKVVLAPGTEAAAQPDFHVFHRYAANFPWVSHASWLLLQMLRWGQVTEPIDVLAAARSVYRPDLYREAARELGVAAPGVDVKSEGTHGAPWSIEAADGRRIEMGPDLFLDGRPFDPTALVAYLADSPVHALRVRLDALAARNP
jgi:nitrate/nitrite transport system substrate-binding protein